MSQHRSRTDPIYKKDTKSGARHKQMQKPPAVRFSPPANLLALQHAAGNQSVGDLLKSNNERDTEARRSIPDMVQQVLRSSGRPMDSGTRTLVGSYFPHKLDQVRFHTDEAAVRSTRALNARAYTVGRDVVFGNEQFKPRSQRGKRLILHEMAHVAQQGVARKVDRIRSLQMRGNDRWEREAQLRSRSAPVAEQSTSIPYSTGAAPSGTVQRVFATFKGPAGGVAGMMDRSQRAARRPPKPPSVIIQQAIREQNVTDLDEGTLQHATNYQRLVMLNQLIHATWTGSEKEEAIIRIVATTPLSSAGTFVQQLTEEKSKGKTYLAWLDDVVDGDNNLLLHETLSQLRLKAMGPEKGTKALESAPVLPWHDVMGFFEDAAKFSITRTKEGKVRIVYPVRVSWAKDFEEIQTLKDEGLFDLFLSGHDFEPDQVIVIHDYDQGKFVPIVVEELIGYEHAGIRGFLGHLGTVASLALPGGGAKTVAGKVLQALLRALDVATAIINENRLNIAKWWPNWGPQMIYYVDLVNVGVGVYGLASFATSGAKILKSWEGIFEKWNRERRALKLSDADAGKVATALERQTNDIFSQSRKLHETPKRVSRHSPQSSDRQTGISSPAPVQQPQEGEKIFKELNDELGLSQSQKHLQSPAKEPELVTISGPPKKRGAPKQKNPYGERVSVEGKRKSVTLTKGNGGLLERRVIKIVRRSKSQLKRLRGEFNRKRKVWLKKRADDQYILEFFGKDSEAIANMKAGKLPQGYQVHHNHPLKAGGPNIESNFTLIPTEVRTRISSEFNNALKQTGLKEFNFPIMDYFVPGILTRNK